MLYRESTYASGTFDTYFYERNLMGDIIAVYDSEGTKLISYRYNAWGLVYPVYSNGGRTTSAVNNPFKYRGYYHDSETGFYYLNSRYYDPEICRFLNPDAFVSTGQGLTGYNMFAYCGNDPVNRVDESGQGWLTALVVTATVVVLTVCVAISNYNKNKSAESNPNAQHTKDTYIEDQKDEAFEDYYRYGFFNAGHNGCEVIAVHNLKVALGIESTFGDTALQFQSVDGMWLFGVFGSYPHSIGSVLSLNGIDYSRVSSDELNKSGMYIISYWNTPGDITDGIHTIMIEYDSNMYIAHNLEGKRRDLETPNNNWKEGFICGYYIN